jgi:8-oxo-dGTP pyrophosphatase MutT (NUDIX family)
MRTVTLLFLLRDDEILLAMKKRRYGAGKWNGVGGKADPGETALQAAIRECEEEICVTPLSPKLMGKITFFDRADPTFGHDCRVFTATEWQGEPTETDEMRPQWFKRQNIPYNQMWPDDEYWLPLMLDGKLFTGTVTVDVDKLVSHDIKTVTSLDRE